MRIFCTDDLKNFIIEKFFVINKIERKVFRKCQSGFLFHSTLQKKKIIWHVRKERLPQLGRNEEMANRNAFKESHSILRKYI